MMCCAIKISRVNLSTIQNIEKGNLLHVSLYGIERCRLPHGKCWETFSEGFSGFPDSRSTSPGTSLSRKHTYGIQNGNILSARKSDILSFNESLLNRIKQALLSFYSKSHRVPESHSSSIPAAECGKHLA